MFSVKRVYHHWEKWECYKAGFYNSYPPKGMNKEQAIQVYISFFKDLNLFNEMITKVFNEWKYSCEHFLTNPSINRIAWLGQASVCIYSNVPFVFKASYYNLPKEVQREANKLAEKRINQWIIQNAKKNKTLYQYLEK